MDERRDEGLSLLSSTSDHEFISYNIFVYITAMWVGSDMIEINLVGSN